MSFSSLKVNRKSRLEKVTAELQKTQSQDKSYGDDRMWKVERDKSGNGYAVIRFLPPSEGEELPWAKYWDHGFQGPGGWYIENSLTTLGQKDPVSEYNTELWNNGTEAGKEQARKQKRRLRYVSNVYVIQDPANPHNEGQVKLFQYGKRIYDKLMEALYPEFPSDDPVDPFDLWDGGADFHLKVRLQDGFVNYDRSEFSKPAQFKDTDDEMEAIWKKQYKLSEFTDPDGGRFKSYNDLKTKLHRVLGLTGSVVDTVAEDVSPTFSEPTFNSRETEEPKTVEVDDNYQAASSDVEDTMSYFQDLARS